jgi:hypothetical protein
MQKRLDGNGQEERKDVETRRFEAEDNEGHIRGSKQAEFNEERVRSSEENDKSDLNTLDNRDEIHDTQRSDL